VSDPISQIWPTLPDAAKTGIMRAVIKKARESAANSIMIESQGGQNDIVRQAADRKLAAMGVAH
jgi:hypothetical protein